jgi:hypothetical protein
MTPVGRLVFPGVRARHPDRDTGKREAVIVRHRALTRERRPAKLLFERCPASRTGVCPGFEKPERKAISRPQGFKHEALTRERPASWIETSRTASAFMQRQKSVTETRCKIA